MTNDRRENITGFEEFLKDSSEDFQMTPNENVWNSINNELHTAPRWPYYTLTLIFISLAIFTNLYRSQEEQSSFNSSSTFKQELKINRISNSSKLSKSQISDVASNIKSEKYRASKAMLTNNNIYNSQYSNQNFKNIKAKSFAVIASNSKIISAFPVNNQELKSFNVSDNYTLTEQENTKTIALVENAEHPFPVIEKFVYTAPTIAFLRSSKSSERVIEISNKSKKDKIENLLPKTAFSHKKTKNAWSLYFSPAVSYRKLHGSSQAFNNYRYTNTDVNSAVRHLPMMGMEFGTAIIFNSQRKLRFKLGFQFNLNQYDIRAYNAGPEVTSLSISGIGQTPINTIAYHRNFDGFKETWLKNKHIMVSVPMATELRIMGDNKLSLNIAAGIQPTYMLSENPYLISSNLKNYAKAPSGLLRNLNINGSLESFVSFKSGSIKWTMGPQFRYQLLSNFKKSYSFTEHLTDVGFKIGFIKSIK